MANMEQMIEATGADVEAAIRAGLMELDASRDDVEIEVLDEGSRGMLGLGARNARVRLTVLTPEPPPTPEPSPAITPTEPDARPAAKSEAEASEKDETAVAMSVLREILTFIGFEEASIEVRQSQPADDEWESPLIIDVEGHGTDALIGRRGQTLAALQRITRLIIGQELERRVNLVIDVDGFKVRREQTLNRLAERVADQAIRTNRTVVLEPMPPNERRIIHLALRDHPDVTTESIGEGDRRKVTIIPN